MGRGMSKQAANEPWAAWAESMQKMMSNPAALNPFAGMMGLPGMRRHAGASAAVPLTRSSS